MAMLKLNMDEIRKENARLQEVAKKRASGGSGKKFENDPDQWYKITPGTHRFFILPPGYDDKYTVPGGMPAAPVYKHFKVPGTDEKFSFPCIEKSYYAVEGKTCPICTTIKNIYKWANERGLSDDVTKKLFGGHFFTKSAYMNVVVVGEKKTMTAVVDGEQVVVPHVRILGLPISIYNYVLECLAAVDEDGNPEYGDITDPSSALILEVINEPAKGALRYSNKFLPNRRAVDKDPKVVEGILKSMYDIGSIFKMPSDDKIAKIAVAADKMLSACTSKPIATGAAEQDTSRGPDGGADLFAQFRPDQSKAAPNTENRPSCFGHHVASLQKCMLCPVDADCIPVSKGDESERKNYHAQNS